MLGYSLRRFLRLLQPTLELSPQSFRFTMRIQ
jgi:hypothetical protein